MSVMSKQKMEIAQLDKHARTKLQALEK